MALACYIILLRPQYILYVPQIKILFMDFIEYIIMVEWDLFKLHLFTLALSHTYMRYMNTEWIYSVQTNYIQK